MASTFTKILVHFIFSTKNREPLIAPAIEPKLHAYMVGIARHYDCWTLALNGVEDHVHMLVSLGKRVTIADLMENVKKASSRWINEGKLIERRFHWQDGYAAFSIGESKLETLQGYIARQKAHHKKETYKEELVRFLEKYRVEYDEQYIWA